MPIIQVVYRFRGDTSEDWETKNPILRLNEPGVEIDTGKFKLGDNHTNWLDLDYFVSLSIIRTLIDDALNGTDDVALQAHINNITPHPVYDEGPSFELLYQNAKV